LNILFSLELPENRRGAARDRTTRLPYVEKEEFKAGESRTSMRNLR
jgi:hypothetical protein